MATPMHGTWLLRSAELVGEVPPDGLIPDPLACQDSGMDILESRMLLAAGIISSQSWQAPSDISTEPDAFSLSQTRSRLHRSWHRQPVDR